MKTPTTSSPVVMPKWTDRLSLVTRNLPFAVVHLACFSALWTGVSWPAVVVCLGLYWMRVFFITGFYHRYFSHRSYQTSRVFQAVLALLGTTAMQKGPLWWAGHHRFHHRHSDDEHDVHSPLRGGFWWAHVGWLLQVNRGDDTRWEEVKDLARFPELRFLESQYRIGMVAFAGGVIGLGFWLEHSFPHTGVTWPQVLVWGFVVSTVLLWHTTYMINSGAHMWGSRRFDTQDTSRNNWWLALLTMGEGWHNNHHRYPGSEKNGFYWYEIDITHYGLKVLSWLGLVWDLRRPPRHVYDDALR